MEYSSKRKNYLSSSSSSSSSSSDEAKLFEQYFKEHPQHQQYQQYQQYSPQVRYIQQPQQTILTTSSSQYPAQFETPARYESKWLSSSEQRKPCKPCKSRKHHTTIKSEGDNITVLGYTGKWVNKAEELNWCGQEAISEYPICEDSCPEVVHKKAEQDISYVQDVSIKYLRPPTPQPHGDIVIKMDRDVLPPAAPPIIVRQEQPAPLTPPPLVIREAPPPEMPRLEKKFITVSGKRLPPPPRKLIVEKLPQLPPKPQPIIIERWLAQKQRSRKVVFVKSKEVPVQEKCRNLIIEWDSPKAIIHQQFSDLGVVRADPYEYVRKYGNMLVSFNELPQFVKDIKPCSGVLLASECQTQSHPILEGDVDALCLVDLEREGLSQYSSYVAHVSSPRLQSPTRKIKICTEQAVPQSQVISSEGSQTIMELMFNEVCQALNVSQKDRVNMEQAKEILKQLNIKLGRSFDESQCIEFLNQIKENKHVDMHLLRAAVLTE